MIEDKAQPATNLPLPPDMSRCLGHAYRKGDWCKNIDNCARHVTIHQQDEPWEEIKPPYFRMCSDDKFLAFLEVVR